MHLYLYFNEKNLKPCKMFIYVCMYMYVCMHVLSLIHISEPTRRTPISCCMRYRAMIKSLAACSDPPIEML